MRDRPRQRRVGILDNEGKLSCVARNAGPVERRRQIVADPARRRSHTHHTAILESGAGKRKRARRGEARVLPGKTAFAGPDRAQ